MLRASGLMLFAEYFKFLDLYYFYYLDDHISSTVTLFADDCTTCILYRPVCNVAGLRFGNYRLTSLSVKICVYEQEKLYLLHLSSS